MQRSNHHIKKVSCEAATHPSKAACGPSYKHHPGLPSQKTIDIPIFISTDATFTHLQDLSYL